MPRQKAHISTPKQDSLVLVYNDVAARYFHNHPEVLGAVVDQPVEDLGLVGLHRGPLVTVEPHMPTIVAFDNMVKAGVTGAAVLSDKGEMIANLSISDLRSGSFSVYVHL